MFGPCRPSRKLQPQKWTPASGKRLTRLQLGADLFSALSSMRSLHQFNPRYPAGLASGSEWAGQWQTLTAAMSAKLNPPFRHFISHNCCSDAALSANCQEGLGHLTLQQCVLNESHGYQIKGHKMHRSWEPNFSQGSSSIFNPHLNILDRWHTRRLAYVYSVLKGPSWACGGLSRTDLAWREEP